MSFSGKISKRKNSGAVLLGTFMVPAAFSAVSQSVAGAVLKDSADVVAKVLIDKSMEAELSTGCGVDFVRNNWKWPALGGTIVLIALLAIYFLLIKKEKQQVTTAGVEMSKSNLKVSNEVSPSDKGGMLNSYSEDLSGAPFNKQGRQLVYFEGTPTGNDSGAGENGVAVSNRQKNTY